MHVLNILYNTVIYYYVTEIHMSNNMNYQTVIKIYLNAINLTILNK